MARFTYRLDPTTTDTAKPEFYYREKTFGAPFEEAPKINSASGYKSVFTTNIGLLSRIHIVTPAVVAPNTGITTLRIVYNPGTGSVNMDIPIPADEVFIMPITAPLNGYITDLQISTSSTDYAQIDVRLYGA